MTKETGGQAYPTMSVYDSKKKENVAIYSGMTLRDYLAGQALMGIISKSEFSTCITEGDIKKIMWKFKAYARGSYLYADAMIAERSKP